ncbi:hypothetical protein [Shewanella woodyi]|uniref:hypothetical protein n=1 Tax=Shewanella woodyi TaxID=60961 RepID=UPI0007F8F780|nr:hypothetical protein [Shewanella woodyi]
MHMGFANIIQLVGGVLAISVPFLLLMLIIMHVSSLKRIALAQEEAAKTQAELCKQLASITIEIRHLSDDGKL